jgi:non-specific serine/threonine protein kinase
MTLTGSGGCGKTRLAVETARRVMDRFPDGVHIAELAPTTSPDLVPGTVAAAIGVNEEHGRTITQTLGEHLASRKMLLILDNCEHVLETSRDLVSSLLDATAHLRIVATSREALAVPGERSWRVPSLSVPPQAPRRSHTPGVAPAPTPSPAPSSSGTRHVRLSEVAAAESVLLFVDRARAVRPAFELSESNAAAVASICRRLNGIPLAIELAAARTKVLAPEQIEKHLDDRFRLLKGGRGSMERHQTLRATVDWSYRLLTEDEQRMLRALSVFAGAFTLDAAAAVCGPGAGHDGGDLDVFEVLDLLTHLADKSLVIVDDAGDEARYRMLETIIQYAAEKLDAADETARMRDRHLDFFLARATEAEVALMGPEQASWQRQLQAEVDDILQAMAWGTAAGLSGSDEPSPVTKALTLCACLSRFWAARRHYAAVREALHAALHTGRTEAPAVRATALVTAGDLAMRQGEMDTARSVLEQAVEISCELDDQKALARSLHTLGSVAHLQGSLDEARELLERALSINRERGDPGREAGNLVNLGLVARDRGDLDRAKALYEEGAAIFRKQGDRKGTAVALCNLAPLLRDRGDHDGARAAAADSLAMGSEMGLDHFLAEMLDESAILAILAGEPEPAARFLGAAGVLYDRTGGGRYAYVQRDLERLLPQARDALQASSGSGASWDRACTDGAQLSTEQAVDEALAWLRHERSDR